MNKVTGLAIFTCSVHCHELDSKTVCVCVDRQGPVPAASLQDQLSTGGALWWQRQWEDGQDRPGDWVNSIGWRASQTDIYTVPRHVLEFPAGYVCLLGRFLF